MPVKSPAQRDESVRDAACHVGRWLPVPLKRTR
jgi:hypothetical protein